jgi:7-cyano-7-deazaguanine reductase
MAQSRKNELKGSVLEKKARKLEYDKPNPKILETFLNKYSDRDYEINIKIPEFTCLCPLTGQPDFATIHIRYVPDGKCLESKSLKLYLFSFRNFGEFHEDCVNRILNDCVTASDPRWMEVKGEFNARGGISITPIAEYVKPGFDMFSHIRRN